MESFISSSDLWVEIFKRLPVKTVFRFQCVCKLWNSLLSSHFFVSLHNICTVPNNQKSYLITPYHSFKITQFIVYEPEEQQDEGGVRERVTFITSPLKLGRCDEIFGVVNGVVGLLSNESIVLWNPTIRKHMNNLWPEGVTPTWFVGIGFGLDTVKNHLKVVLISYRPRTPYYHVLTIEQDCYWRRKSITFDRKCEPLGGGCYVNGTIYWVANVSTLLLFDCSREEFETIGLPLELANKDNFSYGRELFNHGGFLSFLLTEGEPKPSFPKPCELWVMDNRRNWRKVLKIPRSVHSFSGNRFMMMDHKNRIKLCSRDLPLRLAMFNNQPVYSLPFEESLFLMNFESCPDPIHCDTGYCRYESRLL